MEGSNKGTVKKEAMSYLEKTQAEYARYLRSKYFSGKDIYGDEIFEKTTINGMTMKSSRFSPTRSYADPVAFLKEVAEAKKKSLADTMKTKETRIPPLKINSESTRKQVVEVPEDVGDESSDSLQEISVDVWNEVQSAKKLAESGAGPSNSRR